MYTLLYIAQSVDGAGEVELQTEVPCYNKNTVYVCV